MSELDHLLERVGADSPVLGQVGDLSLARWEDPSGARLVFGCRDARVDFMLPSFAGRPGVRIANCHALNADVATAEVFDEDGEQLTAMVFAPEQIHHLANAEPVNALVSIVALGVDVAIFGDADAFSPSDASMLTPDKKDEPPPPGYAERGLQWPLRYGAESFISYGSFAKQASNAEPHAWLAGVVVESSTRVVGTTGQSFVPARVRTVAGEIDVCVPGSTAGTPPPPGAVVAGNVYLVGSIDSIGFGSTPRLAAPKRRWWMR